MHTVPLLLLPPLQSPVLFLRVFRKRRFPPQTRKHDRTRRRELVHDLELVEREPFGNEEYPQRDQEDD